MKPPVTDPGSLSAFAVYNGLIPGVKSYEDTNNSPGKAKSKNDRKRKLIKLEEMETPPINTPEPDSSKKRRKRKKKKQNVNSAKEISESPSPSTSNSANAQNGGSPKKKHKKIELDDNAVPQLVNIENGKESKKQRDKNKKNSPPGKKANLVSAKALETETYYPLKNKKPDLVPNPIAKASLNKSKGVKSNSQSGTLTWVDQGPAPNLKSILSPAPVVDSQIQGKSLFEWLIHPMPVTTFFDKHWEKAPLHIKRNNEDSTYYQWIMSSTKLDKVLRSSNIKFGKNIDITSYSNGVRETHNPVGRAMPAVVWDYYANGCSVRFLNPQTYIKPLWRLNASLQEYLGTFVGANVYLTPPDSQGFAPHYDDIEAFVLQLEGKKLWKLYKPRTPEEELPRFSSPNFKEEDIGEPIMEVLLEEGDLLYFPRGIIHQAMAVEGQHSLHITLSAYQLNTYADFLKMHLPLALEQSIEESVELRQGLPLDYLSYMGIVHSDNPDKKHIQKRKEFEQKVQRLCRMVIEKPCDLAADQLGKKFIWDSLPPFVTDREKSLTPHGDGEFLVRGEVFNRTEIEPDTEVKLLRKHCVRLVLEEDELRLYYNVDNSLEYHEEEAQFLEVPEEAGPAIEYLIQMYPAYVKIEDLPGKALKIPLVADMWEKGILLTRKMLNPVDEGESLMDSEIEAEEGENSDSDEIGNELDVENDFDEDFDTDEYFNSFEMESMDSDSESSEGDGESEDNFDESEFYNMLNDAEEEYTFDDGDILGMEDEEDDDEDSTMGPSYIEEIDSDTEEFGDIRDSNEDDDSEDEPILLNPKKKQNKK